VDFCGSSFLFVKRRRIKTKSGNEHEPQKGAKRTKNLRLAFVFAPGFVFAPLVNFGGHDPVFAFSFPFLHFRLRATLSAGLLAA
jgi:hypothetical protein